MAEPRLFVIREEEAGASLAHYLKNRLQLSGARIRSLKFAPEGITVNGRRVRTDYILAAGDVLSVPRNDSSAAARKLQSAAEAAGLPDVIWEDDVLIVVDKPAGLAMHPAGGHRTDTLANRLRAWLDRSDPAASVHFAGRLDKDTSGLVLCAKNAAAAEILRKERADGTLTKTYLALAAGDFSESETENVIDLPLRPVRDPGSGLIRMLPDPSGLPARTAYTVRRIFPGYALLELRIATGRTHQIRAHLSAASHPLLGDPLYGDPAVNRQCEPFLSRTALHASQLSFLHPESTENMTCRSPLPEDMAAILASEQKEPSSSGPRIIS